MNYAYIFDQLESNKLVFKSLFAPLKPAEFLWQEAEGKWCLLEILCHLIDEEVEDFRMRVKTTLDSPNTYPPKIDPVGWVESRKYKSQDFELKLNSFLIEREKSVEWLRSLQNPNWLNGYAHPSLGQLTAHLFLTNWLAHDYLHIRQIVRIRRAYLKEIAKENLSYAGQW